VTLTPRRVRHGAQVLAAIAVFVLSGCASYTSVSERTSELLRKRDYAGALTQLDRVSKRSDDLLVALDRGLVYHYGDAYDSSNVAFETAERLIDETYTKSLSAEAFAFLTSDNVRAYEGVTFEHAMVPFYRALNYVALGRRDDAIVEARKANLVLERATGDLTDPAYGDDAFLQYFTGLLYAWGGEWNDAYVSFRRAEEVYRTAATGGGPPVPESLGADLVLAAERLGFVEDVAAWRERFPSAEAETIEGATGEVVLLLETGFVPALREARLDIPILKTDSKKDSDAWHVAFDACDRVGRYSRDDTSIAYWLAIAYPLLEDDVPRRRIVNLYAGGASTSFELVSDFAFHARRSYQDRQRSLLVRTAARAILKAVAKKQADDVDSALGLLVNVVGALTEHADLRSWRSLPHDLWMARLDLPEGEHDLTLETSDGERVTLEGVTVRRGQRSFVSYRLF